VAAVFSLNFFRAASFTGGPVEQYTVPAGKLAVVKCITIVWGDVIASGVDAWVMTEDDCKLWRYTWAFTVSDPTNFGGTALGWGAWTLLEGESLYTQTVAGTVDFQASGYLLALP
jgi:hypothetical protein